MTRWQLIWLAVKILCRLLFRRDISSVLDIFAPKVEPVAEAVETVATKAPRMAYDVIKSRLTHIGMLVLAFATYAAADGYFNAYDGLTKLNKRISGGTGINIAGGVITATGSAVVEGSIPFANVSAGTNAAYLGKNATASSANAYKGNSAPSATEFSRLAGVTAPIQGQISSVRITAELKPDLSNVVPTVNGVAAAGTGPTASRVDHVHPVDTSREPANANIQTHISSTSNPHSVTKAQVGLGNVDNTSDLNKPISTATQTALNLKANTASLATVATTGSYTSLIDKPATYTLPTASTTVKGGIKVDGTTIVMDGNGVASATVSSGVTDVNGQTGAVTVTPANIGAATLTAFTNYTSTDRPARSEVLQSANYPVKNVLALGILNNGSDQSMAINALFAAAVDGDTFYFPKGTYGHNVPLVLGDKAIRVIGDGPHATYFKALSAMSRSFYRAASASVVYRAEISNVGVLCEKLSNYAFELQAWKQANLKRIYIEDALVDGMLLGQAAVAGSQNMFYEANIEDIEVYQKTGGWLPDPNLRVNKGIHLHNTASDNFISKVVVAYAKTAGIHDEAYGNNTYSKIHPWGNSTYPMQYGMIVEGKASITNSEFDTNATAGVKVGATGLVSVTSSLFANNTPTGVEIANTAPGVVIAGNTYDSGVTNKYTGTPGAGFTFTDGLTYGTAAGNLVQLDGSSKVPAPLIPTLNQSTTGTAAGLSATLATGSGGTGVTDFAFNTTTHNKMASFAGTVGTGQCVQTDSSGNLTTTGSACGTGSGSGITALTGDVTASGTGSVAASVVKVNGASLPISKAVLGTNASGQIVETTSSVYSGANSVPITDGSGNLNLYKNASIGFITQNPGTTGTAYYPYNKIINYANGTAGHPYFSLRNSWGNTTTDAASSANQNLGNYRWYSRGATGDKDAADISVVADSQHTDTDQPVSMRFYLGGIGTSNNPTERMRIASDGKVSFGTASGGTATLQSTSHATKGLLTIDSPVSTTGNLTAKTFTGTIPAATTYGATTTIDLALGFLPSVTLTGNPTLAFSNPVAGQVHFLELIQDATGGRTVTWPSTGLVCTWRNADGTTTAPTQVTTANSHNFYMIITRSTTTADCFAR